MKPPVSFLFVAVHKGPYLSIQPLEEELGPEKVLYLVEGVSREERAQKALPYLDLDQVEREWGTLERFLQGAGVKAVIRSSSEDVLERNVETLAAAAARDAGIPVFVVEDFPGNYWPQPADRLDGLFVEDESLVSLHSSHGVSPNIIYVTGNPRYNAFICIDRESRRAETRKALGLEDARVMLWAGQPDGDNSYLALERLLLRFDGPEVTLVFRAHPRDTAYQARKYEGLLAKASMKVLDASVYPDILSLYCVSDLVVTQFSSAGVEASYLGVPALFVLFDDLGKQYLRAFKGYEMLPWCHDRCAFLIETEEVVKDVMEQALFDRSSRDQVCANFHRRFGARTDSAQVISQQIRAVVAEGDY
jgi:hypothetical protein